MQSSVHRPHSRLVEALFPGGRLVRTRRLRGGLGARMHVLDIQSATGQRSKVVLRRYRPEDLRYGAPEHVARQYGILQLVQAAGIPAPAPLLLDAAGDYFGVPAMVLSYIPGRPLFTPRNRRRWADDLARALIQVHSVTPQHLDLSRLGTFLGDGMRGEIDHRRDQAQVDPLAREVHAALESNFDRVTWLPPCLVHDDFWPGNTIWNRGRLVAIIDWTTAEVGDPRADVAQCRVDIALSNGLEAADLFLDAYQAAAPVRLPDFWFFDLFRGLRALLYYERWIAGYHDFGLVQLTVDVVGERVRAFLRRALTQIP